MDGSLTIGRRHQQELLAEALRDGPVPCENPAAHHPPQPPLSELYSKVFSDKGRYCAPVAGLSSFLS
eukprot:2859413-Amphidinium_carterae.1